MNQKTTRKYSKNIRGGHHGSILADFFKSILFELKIGPDRFDSLLFPYMMRMNVPSNTKDNTNFRNSVKKELLKPTMTWKVFIKALNFLNVWKFELTVTLYHRNHKTSIHSKTIVLDHDIKLEVEEEEVDNETD